MIIVTSSHIHGKRIVKTLGMVRGNTVRARHAGKDILAVFRNMVGGEIEEYTKMLAEAREQAARLAGQLEALQRQQEKAEAAEKAAGKTPKTKGGE